MAASICWVDRVEKHSDGVLVYFSDARDVVLSHEKTPTRYLITATPPPNLTGNPMVLPALPAELNDVIFVRNGPEDTCRMTVVSEAGNIGIRAEAAVALPGIMSMNGNKPQRSSDFIPAR